MGRNLYGSMYPLLLGNRDCWRLWGQLWRSGPKLHGSIL